MITIMTDTVSLLEGISKVTLSLLSSSHPVCNVIKRFVHFSPQYSQHEINFIILLIVNISLEERSISSHTANITFISSAGSSAYTSYTGYIRYNMHHVHEWASNVER